MDVLKRTRTVQRTTFTQTLKKLELMSKELMSINIFELEIELNVFTSKAERLEQTHFTVLSGLTDSEIDEE